MDSWGSVPWPTWIYLFFVAEFVLENGLILEQRLIFGHILEKNGSFPLKNMRFSKNREIIVTYRETVRYS